MPRKSLRDAIGAPCPYCGNPMQPDDSQRRPSRDHIRPKSKGFTLADPANRAVVCQQCNEDKGSRSLASFLYRLRRAGDPRAPIVEAYARSRGDAPQIQL